MRKPDSPEDVGLLSRFLSNSVARGCEGLTLVRPNDNVTCLMYFFWDDSMAALKWQEFEGALLETWRCCGLLRTVIVTDSRHDSVERFASRFSNVEIQVESRLVPGDINSMSYDCNARLHERFSTRYVLIVQNDGFPIRNGLDEFVDLGFDFYGAPHCRPAWLPSVLTRILRYCPSNGGFSLRTRKLCQLGAVLWERGQFEKRQFVEEVMAEDYFYTRTLPRSGFANWIRRSQASSFLSDRFSYGATFPLTAQDVPFGFHTATAFGALVRKFNLML